jgi:arylsulfatase A-like enzyme
LLSLAGLPIPEGVEGMDLIHCALGEPGPEPEAAFLQGMGATAIFEDGHEWRALRDKRFTYARYRDSDDGNELLFDNVADPDQLTNLVDDPSYAETLARCCIMLQQRMDELNDTFESCTWYRDHWTENRLILCTATA